jgi:hypothetical protein
MKIPCCTAEKIFLDIKQYLINPKKYTVYFEVIPSEFHDVLNFIKRLNYNTCSILYDKHVLLIEWN